MHTVITVMMHLSLFCLGRWGHLKKKKIALGHEFWLLFLVSKCRFYKPHQNKVGLWPENVHLWLGEVQNPYFMLYPPSEQNNGRYKLVTVFVHLSRLQTVIKLYTFGTCRCVQSSCILINNAIHWCLCPWWSLMS